MLKILWEKFINWILGISKTPVEDPYVPEVKEELPVTENVEKPTMEEKEVSLQITENLLVKGSTNRRGDAMRDLRGIVLHWVGAVNQTSLQTRNFIANRTDFGSYNYLINHDGEIMRLIPENEVAWHVGTSQPDPVSKLIYTPRAREIIGDQVANAKTANWHTIGIGMNHKTWNEFTPETLNSCISLCADICRRTGLDPSRISNHWEMVGWKRCPEFWAKDPAQFEFFKDQVRKAIGV